MPRFNGDKYNTAQDSTPGWKTHNPRHVVLLIAVAGERFGCPCGCAGWPLGEKATFAMGHDARLRGILIRAHLMGKKIMYVAQSRTDGQWRHTDMPPLDAATVAGKHLWTPYLDQAVLKREGKNREVLQRSMGSQRLIQVGRWEYTGQVCAVYRDERNTDMVEVEYVNAAGDIKRARMPLGEAIPA